MIRVRQLCPLRFNDYETLDAIGTKGRILLVWSTNYLKVHTFIKTYSITVILKRDNFELMITGVYGPQQNRDKIRFVNDLRSIRALSDLPWLINGDFNILRTLSDTTGNHTEMNSFLEFNRFISDANLFDVP